MPKTLDSVSTLTSISSSDLVVVTGGLFESAAPAHTSATTNTNATTTTENLSCPAGTAPSKLEITGNLAVDLPGVKGTGNMTYRKFDCPSIAPVAPTVAPTTRQSP
jgi:hypothetical protein